jgi:hypothetical protein
MNIAECNFDGGDCCGQCETITITLENNAQAAQGSREGIYHNSSMVNGKPSWTSTSQAIWYDQDYDNWKVGSLDDIGTSMVGMKSDSANGCPFDKGSEEWNYWYNDVWTSAGPNEIKLDCLKGNFPRYQSLIQTNLENLQNCFDEIES